MGFDLASFKDFAGKVQRKLEDFFPGVLEIDGEEYVVATYGGERDGDLETGGYVESMRRVVRLRKDLYADEPPQGVAVVLDGEAGKVDRVDVRKWEDSWSITVELER